MAFNTIVMPYRENQIDETTIGWILKMLKDRTIPYLGSSKVSVFVSKGYPQGVVLLPLLYCLVKDNLFRILNDRDYYAHASYWKEHSMSPGSLMDTKWKHLQGQDFIVPRTRTTNHNQSHLAV